MVTIERYPHSTAKIRIVQHCAAISAIAELLFYRELRTIITAKC